MKEAKDRYRTTIDTIKSQWTVSRGAKSLPRPAIVYTIPIKSIGDGSNGNETVRAHI
jgi:hypothetical protein